MTPKLNRFSLTTVPLGVWLACLLGAMPAAHAQLEVNVSPKPQLASVSPKAGESQPLDPVLYPSTTLPTAEPNPNPSKAPVKEPVKARAVVVNIDSRTLDYDEKNKVYIATGNVRVVVSGQNSEMTADKVIYDKTRDFMVADGHVIITKNGQRTEGSYAKIDLTRSSALITDPITTVDSVQIQGKLSMSTTKYVEVENGKIIIDTKTFAKKAGFNPNLPTGGPADARNNMANLTDPNLSQTGGATSNNSGTGIPLGNGLSSSIIPVTLSNTTAGIAPTAELTKGKPVPGWKTVRDTEKATFKKARSDAEKQLLASTNTAAGLDPEMLDLTQTDANTQILAPKGLHVNSEEIEVRRGEDGYDKIDLIKPTLFMGKHKIGTMQRNDLSYDEFNRQLVYQGPDIGGDPQFGGAYAGPGWDAQIGKGSLRISPVLTYGSATQTKDGKFKQLPAGAGVGLLTHYRDPRNWIDLGYSTRSNQPILYGETRLIRDTTRLQYGINQFTSNGFLGYQQPQAIAEVNDTRKIAEYKNFELDSYSSFGVAKDNFFPNNTRRVFVKATGPKPIIGGKAQVQFQIVNQKPLLSYTKWGSNFNIGARAQAVLAGYLTSSGTDTFALLRAGPSFNFNIRNRLGSSFQFFSATTSGRTPFVYDSYYRGTQNLTMSNQVRVNDFFSIGLRQDLNLKKDNAQNALLTGNTAYILVGPPEVKLSLGYDFISKRSSFNFNYYPGAANGKQTVDFKKLRMYDPPNFSNPLEFQR